MSAGEEPWREALDDALLAAPAPRTPAELLRRLPAPWRGDPAVARAARELLWLHQAANRAFGVPVPAGFAGRVAEAAGAALPRRPAFPWPRLASAGASFAAFAALALLLRPGAPAGPAAGVAARPAELRLDFSDSVFALAAPPSASWRVPVALPAAPSLAEVGHGLGAPVRPVASSVGKAFSFLGELPALAGRTM